MLQRYWKSPDDPACSKKTCGWHLPAPPGDGQRGRCPIGFKDNARHDRKRNCGSLHLQPTGKGFKANSPLSANNKFS